MRRQTIVLICLSLSVTAWGASPDTRKHSAWQPVGSAPPAIQAAVAADPVSHTIYIGSYGGGVPFKSTDAAETGFPITSGIGDYAIITALAMDPDSPGTRCAATYYRSVYKTATGGR